jgi:predicted nucleic acid-binding protein
MARFWAVQSSRRRGLLISDAVRAAVRYSSSLDNAAANDTDFERIEAIAVWRL